MDQDSTTDVVLCPADSLVHLGGWGAVGSPDSRKGEARGSRVKNSKNEDYTRQQKGALMGF